MLDVILKNFDAPDETRVFEKGKFETVRVGGMVIGRATYQPGWKWSEHVSPLAGTAFCGVEHVGMVISGRATAAMEGGEVYELGPGTILYIPPEPHDSWVVGDETYVSLHFGEQMNTPSSRLMRAAPPDAHVAVGPPPANLLSIENGVSGRT